MSLGRYSFRSSTNAVVGSVQDPQIDLGENVMLKLANEIAGQLLAQQTNRFNTMPLIPKDQLNKMVLPAGGALKMNMTVEDVRIEVNNQDLQLKVKFGFARSS